MFTSLAGFLDLLNLIKSNRKRQILPIKSSLQVCFGLVQAFQSLGRILWGLGFSKSDYWLLLLFGILLIVAGVGLIVFNKLKPTSIFALLGRAIPSLVVAVLLLVFE